VAVGKKRVQTKEKYKLRLTTKAYKLSYNYLKLHHKYMALQRTTVAGQWLSSDEVGALIDTNTTMTQERECGFYAVRTNIYKQDSQSAEWSEEILLLSE
jgi:hypothetical protein